MKKILMVSLMAAVLLSVMTIAEAGMINYKRRNAAAAKKGAATATSRPATAAKPAATAMSTDRYGTTTMNKADSMTKEVPAKRY